jgi:hypothetical protein
MWECGLGVGVDVGVAAPVYRLHRVALRCWCVGFGRSVDLVIDSYGAWSWDHVVLCCVVCCTGFQPVFLINWPISLLLYQEKSKYFAFFSDFHNHPLVFDGPHSTACQSCKQKSDCKYKSHFLYITCNEDSLKEGQWLKFCAGVRIGAVCKEKKEARDYSKTGFSENI